MSESTEIVQYKELCRTARNYELKLWYVPLSAIAISLMFSVAIFKVDFLACKAGLALMNFISFTAFLVMYLKDRCYLVYLQKSIKKIHEKDQRFIKLAQFSGKMEIEPDDTFFMRYAKRHSATTFMFWALFIFLIINFACCAYSIWQFLTA
jgi:hypothetical protein